MLGNINASVVCSMCCNIRMIKLRWLLHMVVEWKCYNSLHDGAFSYDLMYFRAIQCPAFVLPHESTME